MDKTQNKNQPQASSSSNSNSGTTYEETCFYNNLDKPSSNNEYAASRKCYTKLLNRAEFHSGLNPNNDNYYYEPVNRYHRTISVHRNTAIKTSQDALTFRTFPRLLENRRNWMSPANHIIRQVSLERRAQNIANRMEQDVILMENSPTSEQLRKEALRDMPQCLTVKRIIKKKLNTCVKRQCKRKPLSVYKNMKYFLSIKITTMQNSLKSLIYSFELWYNSLKIIEGHFGSGIATYFKFFRWLFIMNCLIMIFIIGFIVIPQLLLIYTNSKGFANQVNNTNNNGTMAHDVKWDSLLQNNYSFKLLDIFTGEGHFTHSVMYYGFYKHDVVKLISNQSYNISFAYFFIMLCVYLFSSIILSLSMAKSYRRSFIETQGGLKNVYAHKMFCGWDYSIATEKAADLKLSFIYNEIKELINDSFKKPKRKSLQQNCWTVILQMMANSIIAVLLIGSGYAVWNLLEKYGYANDNSSGTVVITAVVINFIMVVLPDIFSFIVCYEDYRTPKTVLYITLIRIFLLKTVVIGVFLAFWLSVSKHDNCWENVVGQHIYRLILFDFLFSVLLTTLAEGIRHYIYKTFWKGIGVPNFDIAKYTLNLMYNQSLFWIGLFFCPLLSTVIVIKLFCTWYIRRTCLLYFCQPSSKSWRAAQTQAWFLIFSFISLLLVLITLAYIVTNVPTSSCGPFGPYHYIYEVVIKGLFQLEQSSKLSKIFMYTMKPGTIALMLVAMCVLVYYIRAKAFAQKDMVNILKNMLVLEAKDKEFLLENISKVTEGQWQYNLHNKSSKADTEEFSTWKNIDGGVQANTESEHVEPFLNDPNSGINLF